MEQLNLHKLVNLKKRMTKYDCEIGAELMAVIDKHIELQRKVSDEKNKKRRDEYVFEEAYCDECGGDYPRSYIHKHRQNCLKKASKSKK
jgi:hypothetical protein